MMGDAVLKTTPLSPHRADRIATNTVTQQWLSSSDSRRQLAYYMYRGIESVTTNS